MKIPLLLATVVVLLIFSPELHAHPGKTDAYGGHRCLKDCAEWDLYYKEYHLHDKDGRPVRVAQRKPRTKPKPAEETLPEQLQAPARETAPPAVAASAAVDPEAGLVPLPWGLALILLLFLLLRQRSKREKERSQA